MKTLPLAASHRHLTPRVHSKSSAPAASNPTGKPAPAPPTQAAKPPSPSAKPTPPKEPTHPVIPPTERVKIFLCSAEGDVIHRDKFATYLAPLLVNQAEVWHSGKVNPGANTQKEIENALKRSHLLVALVTANLLASKACNNQIGTALGRPIDVIPVLVSPCLWEMTDLGKQDPLPKNKKPIASWAKPEEGWNDVVLGIQAWISMGGSESHVQSPSESDSVSDEDGPIRPFEPNSGSNVTSSTADNEKAANRKNKYNVAGSDGDFPAHVQAEDHAICTQLTKLEKATFTLAKHLNLSGQADAPARDLAPLVTAQLVHKLSGKDVVRLLNQVDEDLKDDARFADERRALRHLLHRILPIASDWRPLVEQGRAHLTKRGYVDLPLGTLTLAETIVAGIDRRRCCFVSNASKTPLGQALVRVPAAADFYFDGSGQRAAELTTGNLAIQLLNLSPDDPSLRNKERTRRRVEETLQYYAETVGDNYLPRWLVLDDHLFQTAPSESSTSEVDSNEVRLMATVRALRSYLPSLRIVRLAPEEAPGEFNYALHINDYLRKPM
ncbi:MAG: toll/interleukin-1 receptor domain-containing protein [Polyangiaceae bacterium]|nr:toll/interleukin-1 receptor domain-containing protein [Polyangiaceae bacterium]